MSSPIAVSAPIRSSYADDPDFRELIDVFLDAVPQRAAELKAASESGDLEDLRIKAHQLKGAGGGFGFHGLSELAASLEKACKARSPQHIAAVLQDTLDYLSRVAR
jgi:histidine phosphotransfer protein HptB